MTPIRSDPFAQAPKGENDLAARLSALRPGNSLTVIGIDRSRIGDIVSGHPSAPCLLRLDLARSSTPQTAIERILDDLADLAATLWPQWDAADHEPRPSLASSWRNAATRAVLQGRRPRFAWLVRETEFANLRSLFPDLVLLAEVDALRHDLAAPIIATLEWCARHGAAVVALLAEAPAPEPPWDRLLHRIATFEPAPAEPLSQRLILPQSRAAARGSAIERRLREALEAVPDLAGLFEHEVTLRLGPLGPTPRVDLVWLDGKVVVELDGAEHARDPNYGADRHRDYELLVAGFLVLRLTNAEVELDLGRSLDKVRRVVDLRRGRI